MAKFFENKKVLQVGLGILGGGTSMAKFILDEGGELTVTDLRSHEILKREIHTVNKYASKYKKGVEYVLEAHNEELFDKADAVLFNPAVPYFSKWPQYCLDKGIPFYNDLTLFEDYINFKYKDNKPKQIWITGTRGKSTTTSFTHHLLGNDAVIGGNVPGQGLQKISSKKCKFFVIETSNYQLEYPIVNKEIVEPDICVITNIFVDHINRHKTFEEYKRVKKLIFSYNPNATLLLSKKEKTVQEIWKNKEHSNLHLVNEFDKLSLKYKRFSANQIISLSFAIEIARMLGISEKDISRRIKTIEIPKMRQEVIFENKKFKVINDSTATNPDALIAAIKNYPDAYFISGGTNADLDFTDLIKEIKKSKLVKQNKLRLIKGTASDKLATVLKLKSEYVIDDFNQVLHEIKSSTKDRKTTIILSPGAKSFGLFKNEYDRGENFNKNVKKLFK